MISPQPFTMRSDSGRGAWKVRDHGLSDSPTPRVTRQFRRLITNIFKEFPADTGGTLLFCGVGSNAHIAKVAAHAARQLAVRGERHVALVDGNMDQHFLSTSFAAGGKKGLIEVVRRQVPLRDALLDTGLDAVSFLPCGDVCRESDHEVSSAGVREALLQLRQTCGYAVIAAGDGQSCLQAFLGRHCDGTYLVVQLGTAERLETSRLADRLAHAGARLLGCVVTEMV